MYRRIVGLSVAVSVFITSCGAAWGTIHRRPAFTEIFAGDQHVLSLDRLVRQTKNGVTYLAPAQLSARAVDFIHPASVNVSTPFATRTSPAGFDTSVTHLIQRPVHVEVLASGPRGTPVDISWEETCGTHLDANGPGASGGAGGQGQHRARLPAVLAVKLPHWSTGQDSCYIASTLQTDRFERDITIELVNY